MSIGYDSPDTLIPVHVGLRQPSFAPPVLGSGGAGGGFAEAPRDNPLLELDFDWAAHGVRPRWIGMESSDCPAALEPSIYHERGGDELRRFLAGAANRGEIAVLIATMGNVNDDRPRGILRAGTCHGHPARRQRVLSSAPAPPSGLPISLAPGVEGPDRDLGLRLQRRPADAPWWSLSLHGMQTATAYGRHRSSPADGSLAADSGRRAWGQPVVAVWISDSGDQRWYLVPDQADWGSILDWLTTQALPEYAPAILRRLRSPLLRDADLLTLAESEAQEALRRARR